MLNIIFLLLLLVFVALIIFSVITGVKQKYINYNNNDKFFFLDKTVTDTIRGISILMIMLAHIVQQLDDRLVLNFTGGKYIKLIVFSWGGVGVGIFFLLSGYGNLVSIGKVINNKSLRINWILKRIIRLIVSFLFSFLFVVFITKLLGVCHYDCQGLCLHFIQLKLPDCSTWYLKIQILLYFLLFLSFIITGLIKNKNNVIIALLFLTVFVLCYDLIAFYCLKLPDYWWKTSFCFVFGTLLYYIKSKVEKKLQNRIYNWICFFVVLLIFSFSYILSIRNTASLVSLFLFAMISASICYMLNIFNVSNKFLSRIGHISLELYLIHIGLMNVIETKIFSFSNNWTLSFNVVFFILISIPLSYLTNTLSSKIVSRIMFNVNK